ncbi:MAG: hypothetical protein ACI9LN_004115 [Saprospiraceae bacterium]|jgi:hypothetical protein
MQPRSMESGRFYLDERMVCSKKGLGAKNSTDFKNGRFFIKMTKFNSA